MKIIRIMLLFSILIFGCNTSYAYEFDSSLLESMGIDDVDLSVFSGSEDQTLGNYIVDISVNNQIVAYSKPISFYDLNGKDHLCVTPDFLEDLPFTKEAKKQVLSESANETDTGKCYLLESLDSAVKVGFASRDQVVQIEMPQLYLDNFDVTWVAPKDRDYGIAGLVFDYNLLGVHSRSKYGGTGYTSNAFRSYGVVGANIGRLRIRGNYQYDSDSNNEKFEWTQIYGFMDIAPLNAKLYAGEIYSRSDLFDSTKFKGISLFTDENMMPSYLQGYAPQVTGSVSTNSIVTIKQYGNVLKSEQVLPGPFAISDLPSYINGLVDVEIEESNGQVTKYQVYISQLPFLTRKGDIRYNINVGKLDVDAKKDIKTQFISADVSYGLSNNISIFGGTIATLNHGGYRSFNIGVGINLEALGAVSFDVTHARNKADNNDVLKGHSYRINYAKRFSSNTTLNLVGYRFSSRNFTSLNNYMDMKSGNRRLYLEKKRFTLSLTQSFPSIDTSFTASVTRGTYWNQRNMYNYNISANKIIRTGFFKNSSVQLTLSKNLDQSSYKSNQIGLFLHIPIGDSQSYVSYSSFYDDYDKRINHQANYYTNSGDANVTLGADISHENDFKGDTRSSFNASYDIDTAQGKFTTTVNYSSNYQRATAGFNGSMTLTQHGLATHQRVHENGSRLIIDAGVAGVPMKNSKNESNMFGLIGVGNTPSYYRTSYVIDNDKLPEDVEIQNSIISVALADGTIAYSYLGAIDGKKVISRIILQDGSYPPFGAVVYRGGVTHEEEVAMIAERGLTYLSGLNVQSRFIVKWSGNACVLEINSLDLDELKNLTCHME